MPDLCGSLNHLVLVSEDMRPAAVAEPSKASPGGQLDGAHRHEVCAARLGLVWVPPLPAPHHLVGVTSARQPVAPAALSLGTGRGNPEGADTPAFGNFLPARTLGCS